MLYQDYKDKLHVNQSWELRDIKTRSPSPRAPGLGYLKIKQKQKRKVKDKATSAQFQMDSNKTFETRKRTTEVQ